MLRFPITALAIGFILLIGGFACLILVIPWSFRKEKLIRTEYIASRAAYWSILTGLIAIFTANLALLIRFIWSK